jgi:hypothetical protein
MDYLRPKAEAIEQDTSLPSAIICDLDGTLALLNGRSPYDASTCENDILNEPVAEVLRSFDKTTIIFMSGRFDTHRAETERWLVHHGFHFQLLYMRKAGDMRKDSTMKRELFDEHVRGKYFVRFVLDDRDSVVELWRSLGLTCFQVAEGNF